MRNKIIALLLALVITTPVFAQTVGSVNYRQLITNYSKAKNAMSELEDKTNELQKYLLDKEDFRNFYYELKTCLKKQVPGEDILTLMGFPDNWMAILRMKCWNRDGHHKNRMQKSPWKSRETGVFKGFKHLWF